MPPQKHLRSTISVVVPAHDRRETIGETLDSLLAQSYGEWEAIVVDDGSTDGTAALVEEYARRDGRIRLQRQPNGGVSRARNNGIALAQGAWTFFLDADDWIVPSAFERLMAAAEADPAADVVYGGYVRVDPDGRELRAPLPEHDADLFPLFARTCAIAIHSCIVRTELVRRAGGFDESLVTCEDWDLWQRISRLGARFVAIADYFAFYRIRAGSASGKGWRMLEDGLRVIDRGHGEDARLPGPQSPRRELLGAARDIARTYFACYAAGLEIAASQDARDMIAVLGEGISGDVDPRGVAETLFNAIPNGLATTASEWPSFPDHVHRLSRDFIEALAERVGSEWLAFGARDALERLVLAQTHEERPRKAGRWYLIEVDLEGPPPQDLALPPGVERVLCTVRSGEQHVDDVEIPVVDGWIPARAFADAIVAGLAWEILQAYLERHVYPSLQIEHEDGAARVRRDGRVLFDGPLDAARTPREGIHDAVGWSVFLQELWGDRSRSADDFYADARNGEEAAPQRAVAPGERVEVDIAEPLPALRLEGRDELGIAVAIAGTPLTVVRCRARRGQIAAAELRRAILVGTAYELCRAAMREAVVLAPAGAPGSLRARLERALAARRSGTGAAVVPAGATVIGRAEGADGTAVSRWISIPVAAAAERLALARRDGDPVSGPQAAGEIRRLLAAPFVLDVESAPRGLSDDSLLRSIEFEAIFGARRDPWEYDSPYEQDKYEQTLSLLPVRPERVLELGCAEGAFTKRLAKRVGALTAADLSQLALARARQACAGTANVAYAQIDAFEGPLGGPYDLIVCSEMLYYAGSQATLERTAQALAAALEPEGHLLTANANVVADDPRAPGFDWDVPFGAAAIERALLATRTLDLECEIRTEHYRVQRYARRRRARVRGMPSRMRADVTRAAAGEMQPQYAERFLPSGGAVRREDTEVNGETTTRLPILMYHRVAPDGTAATRRWRLHPEAFEAQLRYLRDEGYHALTFEQLRAASDRRQPIPQRSVMLTFDDGYADFPTYAMPLLGKYGFRATMFVVTDLVGATNVWDERLEETMPLMDWPTVVALRDGGLEIGSHSSSHRPLVRLTPAELAQDLCRSRLRLHDELGTPVRSVCYPYGLHDPRVLSIAGSCGFHYGVTTNEWRASFGDDLLGLPRLEVRGTETLDEFVAKLTG